MIKQYLGRFVIFLFAAFSLAACNISRSPAPMSEGTISAIAAATISVIQTQDAGLFTATPTATETIPPTATLAPTSTPLPTHTPFPTFTPLPSKTVAPTATPLPTFSPPTPPTPVSSGGSSGGGIIPAETLCNQAELVKDVTIPDGTVLDSQAYFTKIWRVRNVGTCTWAKNYNLVFVDGNDMDGDKITLGKSVAPGKTIDLAVDMRAPEKRGNYEGEWMLRTDAKKTFGVGSAARGPLTVSIEVDYLNTDAAYNFVTNYCAASWESDAGDLPCPGEETNSDGFVLRVDNPSLESRHENEPALVTYPEMVKDGYIEGIYPPVKIKSGDHFVADIGCMAGYTKCNVLFQLKYRIDDGKDKKLDEWYEEYDNSITRVDIDLSSLDGELVQFIFIVKANGSYRDDAAFWLQPHIKR